MIQKARADKEKQKPKKVLKLCPLCRRMFQPDKLEKHASSCRGSSKRKAAVAISRKRNSDAHKRRKTLMRQPTLLVKNSLRKNKSSGRIDVVKTGWIRKGRSVDKDIAAPVCISSSEEDEFVLE